MKIASPGARRYGWLLEIQDEGEVKCVPLTGVLRIGSRRRADIIVEDVTVSGVHLEAQALPDGVLFRDLDSTNGLWAGGGRVTELWAAEGTTITVGQTTITVRPANTTEDDFPLENPLEGMAGSSFVMRRLAAGVRRMSKLASPVLIVGPTGVGKELIAQALHREGPRRAGPFIPMNVSALPRELVETELFGHERGAFTGAVQKRYGAFTEADGGTLFLDEIGELAFEAQPKLLRALDGYEVRSVGASGSGRRPNTRVITATHVALKDRVEAGTFRRDLFHRLEVFIVNVPALRERRGDIVPIAKLLLKRAEEEVGARRLSPAASALLTSFDWPGNVRELRNVIVRAADIACDRRWIEVYDIERALRKDGTRVLTLTPEQAKKWLVLHRGNASAAARAAGVPRTTFRKLVSGAASSEEPEDDVPDSRSGEDE